MGFYDDVLLPPPSDAPQSQAQPSGGGTYADVLTPPPPEPDTPQGNVTYHSSIFPLSRTDQGKVVLDWSSGIPGAIGKAFTLPGRVMSGEVPMPPIGSTNPDDYKAIIPEAVNFAGTFGPVNPAVRSGDRMIPGVATNLERPVRPAPPPAELSATGGRQMDQFGSLPYTINPPHMGQLADTIENRLIDRGVFRDDAKGIYNNLDEMRRSAQPPPPGWESTVIGPASLHSLRQSFGHKFGVQGEHQLAPQIATEELDKFISRPPEGAILDGPFAAAYGADLFQRARGNLAAGYRGADLAALQKEIDLRTASANSGRNLDNTTRAKITGLVLDPNRTRGFIPSETADLEGAVYGDKTTNRLRDASKTLGGGGGVVATGLGAVAGGIGGTAMGLPPWVAYPLGAAIPGSVGRALGGWGAARTQKALEAVSEATRRRSPLYQEQPPLPLQAPSVGRDAIARAMLLNKTPQPTPPVLDYDPNRA